MALRAHYPNRALTPAGEINFRRTRWEHLNKGRDEPTLKHREAACWLRGAERQRIALLTLDEFDLEPGVYWNEFWYWADGLSQQAGDVVLALQEDWGDGFVSPSDYGSIVVLTGAWIDPPYRSRVDIRSALDGTLATIAPDHALAVLIAYPAGYDEHPDDPEAPKVESLGDFDWRQRALMRMYQRLLGFSPVRVTEARPECMWRPRTDLADVMRSSQPSK